MVNSYKEVFLTKLAEHVFRKWALKRKGQLPWAAIISSENEFNIEANVGCGGPV